MKLVALLLALLCVPPAFCELTPDEKAANDSLITAIISSNWSWEQSANGTRSVEEIQFYQDGFAENTNFQWTARWDATGPRILMLENTARAGHHFGQKVYLVFDVSFTHFVGFDFNGRTFVEGF